MCSLYKSLNHSHTVHVFIMKGVYAFMCLNLFLSIFIEQTTETVLKRNNGVYIVYMGASRFPNGAPRNDHSELLSSLIMRNKSTSSVLHTYTNGFSGFAARLSEEEAIHLSKKVGVVSVFPDPILKLHTTRSWDFLKLQTSTDSTPSPQTDLSPNGADTIIGILDTGIWPESESFNDADMGPTPSRWNGVCMGGNNFTCNRKIIGARFYDSFLDGPRDKNGHGTHVSSTAAGRPVDGASYYDLAKGTAKGGSSSRIAMYRVDDSTGQMLGSVLLKAFDDAIYDGVDIISVSIGYKLVKPQEPNFSTNPIAIGAFHAVERGIMVTCSAGNDGPAPSMVVNIAPWILTVAATTIDRDYQTDIVLGVNKIIKGHGINFSNLNKLPVYSLIHGKSAKRNQASEDDARNCVPGTIDAEKVKGKIVVCETSKVMFDALENQGAVGLILIDNIVIGEPRDSGSFPVSVIINQQDAFELLYYIHSSSNPLATILPSVSIVNNKPAPVVATFSSRGPTFGIENLVKPDIAAPGVSILAAWSPLNAQYTLPGREPPPYVTLSGTSMACPHVSGLAALVKSLHPTWSPSAIKSAIMTTATRTNNLNAPITTITGSIATPYDIGSGQITLDGPFQPGLVYETETIDYVQFLCNFGYNESTIQMIALDLPLNFTCPLQSNPDDISNMNYPSIAISNLQQNGNKTVYRTVTNVAEEEQSRYTVVVEAPAGVEVKVVPDVLVFTKEVKKQTFQLTFSKPIKNSGKDKHFFGSITWSNGKYNVRSPFVITNGNYNVCRPFVWVFFVLFVVHLFY